MVQDFERARLEFHPDYIGGWGEVEGELLGNEIAQDRRDEPAFQPLIDCPAGAEHVVVLDDRDTEALREEWVLDKPHPNRGFSSRQDTNTATNILTGYS